MNLEKYPSWSARNREPVFFSILGFLAVIKFCIAIKFCPLCLISKIISGESRANREMKRIKRYLRFNFILRKTIAMSEEMRGTRSEGSELKGRTNAGKRR